MIEHFFKPLIYTPLYNALIYLISILPNESVGLAVILLTCLVRLILLPLTKKSVITQAKLKKLQPELDALRKQYEKDKQEQARQVMLFYKNNDINIFSGMLLLLIQLPIIISLYYIFLRGGLPVVNIDLLYPFLKHLSDVPMNMNFFGLDIGKPSWILAVIAAVTQFAQIQFSVPAIKKAEKGSAPSFKDDLARSMNLQFRYILPVFIFFIALKVSGAVAIYWATGNLFTIAQELFILRKFKKTN